MSEVDLTRLPGTSLADSIITYAVLTRSVAGRLERMMIDAEALPDADERAVNIEELPQHELLEEMLKLNAHVRKITDRVNESLTRTLYRKD